MTQTKQHEKATASQNLPCQFAIGEKVQDIYTGEVKTVSKTYWQHYAGGNTSDYTTEFAEGGWNKSTNLRAYEAPSIEKASASQNRVIKGWDAIKHVENNGGLLRKYADPVDGARVVTLREAREIAKEDCNLIYCEATPQAPNIEAGATLGALIEKHAIPERLLSEHPWPTSDKGEAIAVWRSALVKAFGERESYKASAEKLAEALRAFLALDFAKATITDIAPRIDKAVAALAQWEAGQ